VETGFPCGPTPPPYPNLQPAIARERIELFVIALEIRRVGGFHPGRRQPLIPDRADGAANGRDVIAVGEHRVFLFGNPHPAELARQIGEIRHFDAGDIVKISGIVSITADALGHLPDPAARDMRFGLMNALPLAGNGSPAFPIIALADAGDEQRLAGLETRRLKMVECR
jgi:hypothetical protein